MVLKQILNRQLFASPLLGFEVEDSENLNRELMLAIDARRQIELGKKVSNHHGWHSVNDLFVREEPAFKAIGGRITQAILGLIKNTVKDFDLTQHDVEGEGWVNVNGTGAFNAPHGHGAYLWSGVYYVQVPEQSNGMSGTLEFIDPRNICGTGSSLRPQVFAPKFQGRPKSGHLLIFPSYLVHWVYPNEEEMNRVSIAFNAKIVSRGRKIISAAS